MSRKTKMVKNTLGDIKYKSGTAFLNVTVN